MKILLIYPPYVSPWSPYLSIFSLSAYLKKHSNVDVHIRDLNLDYFDYLMSETFWQDGAITSSGHSTIGRNSRNAFERLRTASEFPSNDAELLSTLEAVEAGIQTATQQFGDTQLHFFKPKHLPPRSHSHLFPYGPSIVPTCSSPYSMYSSEDIRAAVDDVAQNPYLSYFKKDVLPELTDLAPNVVGISLSFPQQHIAAFTLAKLIKQALPKTHISFGGAQMCKIGERIMQSSKFQELLFPLIDSVCLGEGEATLIQLIEALDSNSGLDQVYNLAYLNNSKITFNGPGDLIDVRTLPTPDFSQASLDRYLCNGSYPTLPLQATRGCYWGKCTFCNSHHILGEYRSRTIDNLINDIETLHERYATNHFQFVDEALPPRLMKQLAGHIAERKLSYNWSTYTRFEKMMTKEYCANLAKGGCDSLFLGIEAASSRINQLMDKGVGKTLIIQVLKALKTSGIKTHLFSIIGFPSETRSESQETFNLLMEHRHLYSTYTFVPFILESNSSVARNPDKYGITEIYEDLHNDLSTYFVYETKSGITMEEAQSLYFEFNDKLALAGAHNPIYV